MIIEKGCGKKEGIREDSHKRERFSQMIINKKRFKRFSQKEEILTDAHK